LIGHPHPSLPPSEGEGEGRGKVYPVRNNAPMLCSPAIAGLDFRIIPAGFNAPLEFLTGFTHVKERIEKLMEV